MTHFNDLSTSSVSVGIGLRSPHYREVMESTSLIAPWWEVHSENFFSKGGIALEVLRRVRERYPVSFHGVGLSLGSATPLNQWHLQQLVALVERFDPFLVSEHIAWSEAGGLFANDLLPLPYTEESLKTVVSHIIEVQDRLKRPVLVENPSTYLQFVHSTIPEWEFMAEVAERSGCGILLDVNNICVSSVNHRFDPVHYMDAMPPGAVKEIHLAGHSREEIDGQTVLIDTHGSSVSDEVWALYEQAIQRFGAITTLIEWDTAIPPLAVLVNEAEKARRIGECYAHGK